jgi:YHS domain-containing protein
MSDATNPASGFEQAISSVLAQHQSSIQAERDAADAATARLTKGWADFAAALAKIRTEVLEPVYTALNSKLGPLKPDVTRDVDGVVIRITLPRDDAHPATAAFALSLSHDPAFEKVLLNYSFGVIPALMDVEPPQNLSTPLQAPDTAAVSAWLSERLINTTKSYLEMERNPHYQKRESVMDPVLKESFPRHLAVGTIEHAGTTLYFRSEQSMKTFQADPAKFA